jgi:hypothetical protein
MVVIMKLSNEQLFELSNVAAKKIADSIRSNKGVPSKQDIALIINQTFWLPLARRGLIKQLTSYEEST